MSSFIVPSNPKDQKQIKDAVAEIVISLTRQESEKDNIKAICEVLKDDFDIAPGLVKKTARIIYTAKKAEADQAFDDLETLYEVATKKS